MDEFWRFSIQTRCLTSKKHDIHIKSKFYTYKLLRELIFDIISELVLTKGLGSNHLYII